MSTRPFSLLASSLLLITLNLPAQAQQSHVSGSASARLGVDVGVSAGGVDHRPLRDRDDDDRYGSYHRYGGDDRYEDDGRDDHRPQPGRRFVGGIIGGALGVAGDATRGALSIAGDATRGGIGIARDATRGSLGLARDVTRGTVGVVAGHNSAGGRGQGRVVPRNQAGAGVDLRVGVGVQAGAGANADDRRRAPYPR